LAHWKIVHTPPRKTWTPPSRCENQWDLLLFSIFKDVGHRELHNQHLSISRRKYDPFFLFEISLSSTNWMSSSSSSCFFFPEIDTATRTNEACCCVPCLEPHQLSTGPPWSDHDWWTEKASLYQSKGVLDSWASLIHMQFNYRWHCHSLTRKKISSKILKNKSTLLLFCDYFPKKVALFSRSPISVLNLPSNDFKNTSTLPISYLKKKITSLNTWLQNMNLEKILNTIFWNFCWYCFFIGLS